MYIYIYLLGTYMLKNHFLSSTLLNKNEKYLRSKYIYIYL